MFEWLWKKIFKVKQEFYAWPILTARPASRGIWPRPERQPVPVGYTGFQLYVAEKQRAPAWQTVSSGTEADRVKAPLLWRPWSYDLGSIPILVAYVVASFDKALYDNYVCLVASNKHQINWKEVKRPHSKSKLELNSKKIELECCKIFLSVFVSFFFELKSQTSGTQVWVLSG